MFDYLGDRLSFPLVLQIEQDEYRDGGDDPGYYAQHWDNSVAHTHNLLCQI